MAALVAQLLEDRPELYDWVAGAIAAPATSGKSKKTRRKPMDVKVYRRQISGILHGLDNMRRSQVYWHVSELTDQLRQVQRTARQFLDADDPETALAILMTLLEEAGHGIEYIDDSDGYLGDFVNDLEESVGEAILSLDLGAAERGKLAHQLEKQSAYLSSYGMEEGLDVVIRASTLGWAETATEAEVFGDLIGAKL